jgi:hypothetical protein
MQTLFLAIVVAGFAFFAFVVAWAERYTRDVRAKWEPARVPAAPEQKASLATFGAASNAAR